MTVYDDDEGPLNFNQGALRNAIVVPGRIVVYGFTVYSTSASAVYLGVFDANLVPGNGAVPLWSWPLAAHSGAGFDWTPRGRQFQTGLVLCESSTDATLTATEAECFFDVQFDVYPQQNAPGTGE